MKSDKESWPKFTKEELAAGWENRGEPSDALPQKRVRMSQVDERNEESRRRLRAKLLKYPGTTEANVDEQLHHYEMRDDQKSTLLERGFSNALAEAWLDRAGYPRPPGWHSVFFYPGSSRPRNAVLFWLVILAIAAWFVVPFISA
jgi:hypothetical protein